MKAPSCADGVHHRHTDFLGIIGASIVSDESAADDFFAGLRDSTTIGTDRNITLTDYATSIGDRWKRGLDLTSTADGYSTGLKLRVLPALGHLPLTSTTTGMLDRTIDGWEAQHSPSTIKNITAPVVRAFDKASATTSSPQARPGTGHGEASERALTF